MGLIPDTVIEQVRMRADIVEVIREVVPLKRAGRLWRGLCPFHQEKDASFTVYQDKQIFKCFGCQRGGNVFGFVMQYHNLEFPEAVRHLGGRYGIEVPDTGGTPGAAGKREALYRINEIAVAFLKSALSQAPPSSPATRYLVEKRKLTPETIQKFELGFAPEGWDHLLKELRRRQTPLNLAAELGLIVEKDRGKYYDRFRNRVMFTFRSPAGKAIGFSGRLLDDGEPKYLNSPESSVFKKGGNFFGLNIAGRPINRKDRVIVCEGNFDLVVLHQYGFDESVAVLGSALTERHVTMLRRYTPNIYLLFDADDAGRKAVARSLELFFPAGAHPRVVMLPQGEDPDSFLTGHGAKELEALIEKAPLAMDHAVETLLRKAGKDVEKQTRALDEIVRLLFMMGDPVRQDHYVRRVAELSGIREAAMRQKMTQQSNIRVRRAKTDQPAQQSADPQIPETSIYLMVLAMLRPDLAKRIESDEILELISPENLPEPAKLLIQNCAREAAKKDRNPSKHLDVIHNPEQSSRLTSLLLEYEQKTDPELDSVYDDLVRRLKISAYDRAIGSLKKDLEKAKKNNDIKKLTKIAQEKGELEKLKEEVAGDFYRIN